jgi:hypothetical protein
MWKLIIRFRLHIFSNVLSGQDGLPFDTHDIFTEMITFGKNVQGE